MSSAICWLQTMAAAHSAEVITDVLWTVVGGSIIIQLNILLVILQYSCIWCWRHRYHWRRRRRYSDAVMRLDSIMKRTAAYAFNTVVRVVTTVGTVSDVTGCKLLCNQWSPCLHKPHLISARLNCASRLRAITSTGASFHSCSRLKT